MSLICQKRIAVSMVVTENIFSVWLSIRLTPPFSTLAICSRIFHSRTFSRPHIDDRTAAWHPLPAGRTLWCWPRCTASAVMMVILLHYRPRWLYDHKWAVDAIFRAATANRKIALLRCQQIVDADCLRIILGTSFLHHPEFPLAY